MVAACNAAERTSNYADRIQAEAFEALVQEQQRAAFARLERPKAGAWGQSHESSPHQRRWPSGQAAAHVEKLMGDWRWYVWEPTAHPVSGTFAKGKAPSSGAARAAADQALLAAGYSVEQLFAPPVLKPWRLAPNRRWARNGIDEKDGPCLSVEYTGERWRWYFWAPGESTASAKGRANSREEAKREADHHACKVGYELQP
jgi:hypothetical protein